MNHDRTDDIDETLGTAFRRRGDRLGAPPGDLDDVLRRVDQRRSGRRNLAVVGSVALVAAGVIGIGALGNSPVPAGVAGQPAPTAPVGSVATQLAWRCDRQLEYWGEDGTDVYFASCEQTPIDAAVPVIAQPTATTVAVAVGTAPATTSSVCETSEVGTVPCPTAPVDTSPICEEIDDNGQVTVPCSTATSVPTTTPPMSVSMSEQRYVVAADDSITAIADRFGVTTDQLVNYNEWPARLDHPLDVDDIVMIPPGALESIPSASTIAPTASTSPVTVAG